MGEDLKVGDIIEVNYLGQDRWYPATFKGKASNSVFMVEFDGHPGKTVLALKNRVRRSSRETRVVCFKRRRSTPRAEPGRNMTPVLSEERDAQSECSAADKKESGSADKKSGMLSPSS